MHSGPPARYTPVGGLYGNLSESLTLPFEATYGFVLTLGSMVVAIVVAAKQYDRAYPTTVQLSLPVQAGQQESGIA
jgi:hypothetical protein